MIEKREFHHSTGGHRHCISIMDQFLHLPEFNDSKCIMLYWSKGSEVHTDGIIESALSLKKKLVLPVTKKEEKKLGLKKMAKGGVTGKSMKAMGRNLARAKNQKPGSK